MPRLGLLNSPSERYTSLMHVKILYSDVRCPFSKQFVFKVAVPPSAAITFLSSKQN